MLWLRTAAYTTTFVAMVFGLLPRWVVAAAGGAALVRGLPVLAGMVLIVLGVCVMVWTWGAFGVHGRGTPAPFDPPRRLVARGPYRYVRNPMYLAGVLVLLGEAVLFASPVLLGYTVVYWLATHLLVVGYEERTLARSFGTSYAEYRAAVHRWLPRLVRETPAR